MHPSPFPAPLRQLRKANAWLLAAALVLAAGHAHAQPAPLIKPENLRQLTPRVHVIPDESVPLVPNVGFVVGERAVLVIDTGLGARNGAQVAAVAGRLAALGGKARALYLVTTHFHPEHALGAQAFPAATRLLRSKEQQEDIDESGLQLAKDFAQRSALTAELLRDAQYRAADISFEKEYLLDLGGVSARVMAMGPNHTRGDTAVWVAGERVLFSGDVAMRPQPVFASRYSNMGHWLASLARLQALAPAQVVPSHGPVGGPELIEGYRAYFNEIRERIGAQKKAGRDSPQATQAVIEAMAARYPDRGRLGGAVAAAYKEAP